MKKYFAFAIVGFAITFIFASTFALPALPEEGECPNMDNSIRVCQIGDIYDGVVTGTGTGNGGVAAGGGGIHIIPVALSAMLGL